MHWFRLFDEFVDDPKLGRESGDVRVLVVDLCCLVNQNGRPENNSTGFDVDGLEWRLRRDVSRDVSRLLSLDVLEIDGETGEVCVCNFSARQPKSDNAAERQRRHRANKKKQEKQARAKRRVTEAEPVTGQSRDVSRDMSQAREKEITPLSPSGISPPDENDGPQETKQGTRWQQQPMPMTFERFALEHQAEKGATLLDVTEVYANFQDHWLAASGRNSTKRDWLATWRKWFREEYARSEKRRLPGPGGSARPSSVDQSIEETRRWAESRRGAGGAH